jgi:HlyD family secretion protein
MERTALGLQVEDQVNAPVIGMVEGFVDGLVVEASERAGQEHRTLPPLSSRGRRKRRDLQRLLSPIDGTVTNLAAWTVGGVVKPGDTIPNVVPLSATPEIEALVLNKDIGVVLAGQQVTVKSTPSRSPATARSTGRYSTSRATPTRMTSSVCFHRDRMWVLIYVGEANEIQIVSALNSFSQETRLPNIAGLKDSAP